MYLTGSEKKLENAGVKLHNLYSSPNFSEAIELDARDKGANIMHVGEEKYEKISSEYAKEMFSWVVRFEAPATMYLCWGLRFSRTLRSNLV